MRSVGMSVFIMLLAASDVMAQASRATRPDVEREIGRVIRQRLDFVGRGDAVAWGRLVADDCLCGTTTKAAIQQEIAGRSPNMKNWYGEILDLQVRVHKDVAVTRYRVTEYVEVSGKRITTQQRRMETYARRGGRWLLIAGIDNLIPEDPVVARIDPNTYDDYVGHYVYGPGMVDTVTREGDRLMVQSTGQAKEEIFPENETTFFGKGQDWRLIFVKDEQGRVTSVLYRQNRQEVIGRKIR